MTQALVLCSLMMRPVMGFGRALHKLFGEVIDRGSDGTAMHRLVGQNARHKSERSFVGNVRKCRPQKRLELPNPMLASACNVVLARH